MIYELSQLSLPARQLPAIVKRFETVDVRLFEKHGIKQLGFWTVAIGESNQDLIYILQWESLAERDRNLPRSSGSRMDRSAPKKRGGRPPAGVDY